MNQRIWRVLLPVSLATGLSLLGDTSLYTVLPTQFDVAGIELVQVGIILSVNRFIRLALNGPAGLLVDRWPRRRLFVPALFIGALSSAIYALSSSFWPLLAGRLLWGLSWTGIWVAGNAIILDISRLSSRGRQVGWYNFAFFLGAAGGSVLGGFLTDALGYHQAMGVAAAGTLLGALAAWAFLPETHQPLSRAAAKANALARQPVLLSGRRRGELVSAVLLLGANRLVMAGVLIATLGRYLEQQFGDSLQLAGRELGVASLTGLALGGTTLFGMLASPLAGWLSDRAGRRWPVAAVGLVLGLLGFVLVARGGALPIILGLALASLGSGSNQSLATTLVGDLVHPDRRGGFLGVLFTAGDLGSAVGPPLAYGLLEVVGLSVVYLLAAGLLAGMVGVAGYWARGRFEL